MSNTPETDNLARGNHVVPTEFAQQLERERDEAREDLEFRRELYKVQEELFENARSERDEAREEVEKWEQTACDKLSEVCRQIEKTRIVTEQRDTLLIVIEAATILIAAKGRHNTMLAYNGLRDALQSITPNEP
jgi:hypothetical protein